MKRSTPPQLDFFPSAPQGVSAPVKIDLGPAEVSEHARDLGAKLPSRVRLGTSSWSFPGWTGLVFNQDAPQTKLAREGLTHYAKHPLLRTVGIDRTFYAPIPAATYAEYAKQVPEDFRFLVKAPETVTLARFPDHARYGVSKGADNPRYLDASKTRDEVVQPFVEGLGEKAGPLVFQFPPQDPRAMGGPKLFAETLHNFLRALPKGPLYAVEVRNEELMTPELGQALADVGAAPVLAGWKNLPDLDEQARRLGALEAPALVVRWMLAAGLDHESAKERFQPFNRLVEEDLPRRNSIAGLAGRALRMGKSVHVTVNNKAEGSAPCSIEKLAEAIVGQT